MSIEAQAPVTLPKLEARDPVVLERVTALAPIEVTRLVALPPVALPIILYDSLTESAEYPGLWS